MRKFKVTDKTDPKQIKMRVVKGFACLCFVADKDRHSKQCWLRFQGWQSNWIKRVCVLKTNKN